MSNGTGDTAKDGKDRRRVIVQVKKLGGGTSESVIYLSREAHVDHLHPENVRRVEWLRDADVIFDMTEGRVVSHLVLAPPHKKRKAKAKLEIAPGFKLHGWLSSVCPRTFRENVLDECLAEGTRLHQEKLAAGDLKGARRVRWAMRWWMVRAVAGGFITGAFLLVGALRKSSD